MADIKENEMSTASDCAYVRALDSNGNSIRISKSDLASVVGGLIFKTYTITATPNPSGSVSPWTHYINVNTVVDNNKIIGYSVFSKSTDLAHAVFSKDTNTCYVYSMSNSEVTIKIICLL